MLGSCLETLNTMETVQEKNTTRYINILLLRYPDTSAKLFRLISRNFYNHTSIGISHSDGVFYSYMKTGFRKEFPALHPTYKSHEVPCQLYQVQVSEEVYQVTKAVLQDHEKQANKFKYNTMGLILCLLHVVFERKDRYFCSQFVSEILEQMTTGFLTKHTTLYLPDDFTKMDGLELRYSGDLSQLVGRKKSALLPTA